MKITILDKNGTKKAEVDTIIFSGKVRKDIIQRAIEIEKKSNIKIEKMGHINLYSQRSIDDYISLLKRPSSNGRSAKFKKSVSIH